MAEQPDIIQAVRNYFAGLADLSPLLEDRVFAIELPGNEAVSSPRKALVVSPSGGTSKDSYAQLVNIRFDLFCYGETAAEADKVRRVAHENLKQMSRTAAPSADAFGVSNQVLLHSATESSGPQFFRDPDTNWPVSVESWVVMASERLIS